MISLYLLIIMDEYGDCDDNGKKTIDVTTPLN